MLAYQLKRIALAAVSRNVAERDAVAALCTYASRAAETSDRRRIELAEARNERLRDLEYDRQEDSRHE